MAAILVVCTGNVCRSPIAEGSLRVALRARLGSSAPDVASAGTAGWEGWVADPGSVEAAAELGIDLSGHRARGLDPREVSAAALTVTMSRSQRAQVAGLVPEAAARTFTLKEFVRLLEALPPDEGDGDDPARLPALVRRADALRRQGSEGDPLDEDVADPLGMPLASFRAIAREIDAWCRRLVLGLFGPASVRSGTAAGGE